MKLRQAKEKEKSTIERDNIAQEVLNKKPSKLLTEAIDDRFRELDSKGKGKVRGIGKGKGKDIEYLALATERPDTKGEVFVHINV